MSSPLTFQEMASMSVAFAAGRSANMTPVALLIRRIRGVWCFTLDGTPCNAPLFRTAADAVASITPHKVDGKGDNRPPATPMPSGGVNRHD